MDLTTFGMAGVAAITVICYLAATAVKQTPLANKWLPTICGTLGGVLGVLAWCGSVPDFPAGDPLTALAVGIVSGLSLIHISEPTRLTVRSRMPSSA